MPTKEQIDLGASYFDIEAAKARYAAKEHRKLGTDLADKIDAEAAAHEETAKQLRRLARG